MMVGPSDEDDEDDYEFGGGDGGGGGGGGGINKMPGSGLDAHMASQVPPPTALDRPEDLAAPGVMDAADIPMETAAAVAPKEPMNRRHNGILTHMSNTQQQVEWMEEKEKKILKQFFLFLNSVLCKFCLWNESLRSFTV